MRKYCHWVISKEEVWAGLRTPVQIVQRLVFSSEVQAVDKHKFFF